MTKAMLCSSFPWKLEALIRDSKFSMEIEGLNRDSIKKWRVGQLKGQGPFPLE